MESQGVSTSLSMITYGPPGTGKSRLARFIAQELGLDLYLSRLDGLISSFLGSTSKNIRALFDFASKRPCILFLDEFDAIAKLRGDTQELGELKRVVNSFLQNLDAASEQTIILAATNHEELLDGAVWRRFTYRMKLSYPDVKQRKLLWEEFLPKEKVQKKELIALIDLSQGFTGADIQEACLRIHRKRITNENGLLIRDAFVALKNLCNGEGESRREPMTLLVNQSPHDIAKILRARDKQIYSTDVLGKILGVSKATAHRWTIEAEG
jgi:SpoVK/Ycf46/Vps4 family AAA+-type ATPase